MSEITLDEALKCPRVCGIDFETTGLNFKTDKPLFLGIGCPTFRGYIDLQKYTKEVLATFLREFFKTHNVILQNAKFDFHFIDENYFKIEGPEDVTYADTMLISQIIDENASHGLDDMVSLWLPDACLMKKRAVDDYIKEHKLKTWLQVPPLLIAERGEEDAVNTEALYQFLRPKLTEAKVYDLEKKLLFVLLRMERNGALLDRTYLESLKLEIQGLMDVIDKKYPDVLLTSPKQVRDYLTTLGVKFIIFTKTGASTATEALEAIENPPEAVQDILEYRHLSHTMSLYVDSFLEKIDSNNVIHCNFRQMGARTGRMSCVNPNLQQIPKKGRLGKWIKTAFIGDITTFDYSQMEAVLYAYDSKDEKMIQAVEEAKDLYGWLAETLYRRKEYTKDERNIGKGLFLGTIYGMGQKKFKKMSQGLDPEGVKDFFGRLKGIQRDIDFQVQTKGYVETFIGRKRHLDLNDSYKGFNARIQGSAADIIKKVIINLPRDLQEKLIIQVHDELVFRGLLPGDIKRIEDCMCDTKPYKLRVEYGSGKTWSEAFDRKELGLK